MDGVSQIVQSLSWTHRCHLIILSLNCGLGDAQRFTYSWPDYNLPDRCYALVPIFWVI